MERITIYPDKKLKERLDEIAREEQRSMNNLLLLIIKKYIESQRK
jgi:predicted transcriptional regulator|tara:strand:- start:644 stop:778 length:135 start_codon:yes stop_codon:yes gene_type:complete